LCCSLFTKKERKKERKNSNPLNVYFEGLDSFPHSNVQTFKDPWEVGTPGLWSVGGGGGQSSNMATHQDGLLAVLNPPLCSKVSGLGTVVSVVEAGVVGVGEGHHELTLLLGHLEINIKINHHNKHTKREVSWEASA